VTNVSLVDLTVTLKTPVPHKEALIEPFRTASSLPTYNSPTSPPSTPTMPHLQGVLNVSDEKLVSSDYLSTQYSSIIDVDASVMLNERTVKIVAWYDNEFGFSSRSRPSYRQSSRSVYRLMLILIFLVFDLAVYMLHQEVSAE